MALTLAAIEIHAAAYLAALAALALPVIAHLRGWSRPSRTSFPATSFLDEAVREASARQRPMDRALLLLRLAAMTAIIFAFTLPVWKPRVPFALGRSADPERDLVFILDASASMRRTVNGSTQFNAAKREIDEALSKLNPGVDRAAVIIASGANPTALLPRMTQNIDALRSRLHAVEPTFDHGYLPRAVQRALELPEASLTVDVEDQAHDAFDRRLRQVEVFTDWQASEWPDGFPTTPTERAAVLRVRSAIPPDENDSNYAIRRVHVSDNEPVLGERISLEISVDVFGNAAQSSAVPLELRVVAFGGTHTQLIRFDSNSTNTGQVSTRLPIVCDESGVQEIAVSLVSGDAIESDNTYHTSVYVRPKREITILSAGRKEEAQQHDRRDAEFSSNELIAAALAPDGDSPYAVRRVHANRVNLDSIRSSDCIIVVDLVAPFSDDGTDTLGNYIRSGGSLFWITDSLMSLNALEALSAKFTDPAWRESRWEAPPLFPDGRGSAYLRFDAFAERSHEITSTPGFAPAPFEGLDAEARHAIESISFSTVHRRLLQDLADEVWLRFDTGEPALTQKYIGRGRILVFAGDWSLRSSDLMREPICVPFLHEVVRALHRRGMTPSSAYIGQSLEVHLPTISHRHETSGHEIRIDPKPAADSPPQFISHESGAVTVRIPLVDVPGPVRFFDSVAGSLRAVTCVQIDPRESDVVALSTQQARDVQRSVNKQSEIGGDSKRPDAGAHDEDSVRSARAVLLWPYLLLTGLAFLLLEQVVLLFVHRSGERRSA